MAIADGFAGVIVFVSWVIMGSAMGIKIIIVPQDDPINIEVIDAVIKKIQGNRVMLIIPCKRVAKYSPVCKSSLSILLNVTASATINTADHMRSMPCHIMFGV